MFIEQNLLQKFLKKIIRKTVSFVIAICPMAVLKFLMILMHARVLFFNRSLGGSVRGRGK